MSNIDTRVKAIAYQNKSAKRDIFAELMETQVSIFLTTGISEDSLKDFLNYPDDKLIFQQGLYEEEGFPFVGTLERMGFKVSIEKCVVNEQEPECVWLALERGKPWKESQAMTLVKRAIEEREELLDEATDKQAAVVELLWEQICQRIQKNDSIQVDEQIFKHGKETDVVRRVTMHITGIYGYYLEFLNHSLWCSIFHVLLSEMAEKEGFELEWRCDQPCIIVLMSKESFTKNS